MPELLWNNTSVPKQDDMWALIPDWKRMGESINAVIPVSSLTERNALKGPGGGAVPNGTAVLRMDQGGVLDYRIGGVWVAGDTGWANVTLLSGIAVTAGTSRYKRRDGDFKIEGNVAGAGLVAATWTHAFTLPPGFRPTKELLFPGSANVAGTGIKVEADGKVSLWVASSSSAWIPLSHIRYEPVVV